MTTRTVEEYLKLPYTIEVVFDQGENYSGWFARVIEWPGCMTQADTFEELGVMIQDAMRAWVETAIEEKQEIPDPRPIEEYSGKFVVRVPKSLHRELVEAAAQDGVSLNAFASIALGKAVGGKQSLGQSNSAALEPELLVNWPRLSDQARRILVINGCAVEAQTIDESLFSNWIDDHLVQVKAAMESGMYRDATSYIQSLRKALEMLCSQSPLIKTYCQVVTILEEQIIQNCQLREGIVGRSLLESRISAQAQATAQIIRKDISVSSSPEKHWTNDDDDEFFHKKEKEMVTQLNQRERSNE
ncbi:MAG: toxin-antitoxin system HicB family antitoxin [Anaerolineales bacterium]